VPLIVAEVGAHVSAGEPIIILEAMKMEAAVNATVSGTVSEINVKVGEQVQTGDVLALVS
jgi:propionyl-CoA carboxylase alpha chain